jgi:hypothetical protein
VHPAQRRFVWINVLGGAAVLASYAHGIATHPATRSDMWGGVPDGLRPLYTVSMLLAAAGYFPLAGFLLFGVAPETARVAWRFRLDLFNALFAAILVASALWMPLTFAMLEAPSAPLWWTIRAVLAVVGAASLGVLGALLALEPKGSRFAYGLALAGCVFFCIQTALLDALVWPAFFPFP